MIKNISLQYQSATDDYLVVTVTNSLDYNPGDTITRAQAQALVDDTTWQVIIMPPPK
jgi:hypothetical protein